MGKTLSRYDEIQIEKAIDILENIVGFHNKNLTQKQYYALIDVMDVLKHIKKQEANMIDSIICPDDAYRIDQAIRFLEMFIQIDGNKCIGLLDVISLLKDLKNKSGN